MSGGKQFLHFTLGPVQGFVSQARRTRDFWAGSFLLSYLTATAMRAVEQAGGTIHFPDVENDPLMQRLREGKGSPKFGSVPNRFVAEVAEGFDGRAVQEAVQAEWRRIADAVWNTDLEGIADEKQRALWKTQIGSFWDMAWAISDNTADSSLLDRRKNWRSHYPPAQAGDKCTMMGEWQELSGEPTPNRAVQDRFWKPVRDRIRNPLDLRESERLCAIAFVKRRFYRVWEKELHPGWELPSAVPSVSYLAAAHWLEQAILHADQKLLSDFHDAAQQAVPGYGEWKSEIACVQQAVEACKGISHRFSSLDGRIFFRSALENRREFEPAQSGPVLKALGGLKAVEFEGGERKRARKLGEPSPFYALLLMDGDSLGAEMANPDHQQPISQALATFTASVPGVVAQNNGFLVYAGGDDVLAILPLEDAISCALEVRGAWKDAFADKPEALRGKTISAAIEFAHMKSPLTVILKDAHKLLDDVAKEETGRDAIAVRVWKPGGEQFTWAMRWDEGDGAALRLSELVEQFQSAEMDEPGHASKPLYRIRERLMMLKGASDFSAGTVEKLLIAEYATSGVLSKEEKKEQIAEKRIKMLLPLCKKTGGGYGAEAAVLMRFLAQKGVER